MSYRSIKRVLGESSLERKIRILFGICLFLLIAGSFLWVNRITEELIRKNTQDKAHELKTQFLLRQHLIGKKLQDLKSESLFKSMAELVRSTPYTTEVISLEQQQIQRWETQPVVAAEPEQRELLMRMVERAESDQENENRLYAFKETEDSSESAPETESFTPPTLDEEDRLFQDLFTENNQYVYYTPVVFQSHCIHCHHAHSSDSEQNDAHTMQLANAKDDLTRRELQFARLQKAPPLFLKITLPYRKSKQAINRSRAILMAGAIVTAFISTLALYLIVRYVIVKPLNHLRDVTEDISLGQTNVRAELNTGDEFQELSRSFNRMLRHLLDSQSQLLAANTDLDKKVDEQAQLNLKLYEMNQIKSEFLANMSHELRTPLNSIIGFSEILEGGKNMDDKHKRFAGNIRKSGRLLLDLINDILDLAKLEAGKMEVNPSEFHIHQLAGELCDMVRNLAETKNIQLVMCADPNLPPMMQDPIKVRQILTNLLSNAIKFTPEGGRISLTAELAPSDRLILHVRDTGVGIAPADQAIIFEKFRQGASALGKDSLTREVSGTGLGLSIVKELCILLGGKIELESEVGKGSTFTVTLPWNVKLLPRISSEISQSIDEITKSQRVDFARTSQTPKVPTEDSNTSQATNSAATVTKTSPTNGIEANPDSPILSSEDS